MDLIYMLTKRYLETAPEPLFTSVNSMEIVEELRRRGYKVDVHDECGMFTSGIRICIYGKAKQE